MFLLFAKKNARVTLSGRAKTSIFDHLARDFFLNENRKRDSLANKKTVALH